ncbi:MAG: helix-turn-helix transcriptional regulator [Candidatus Levybacteria bacterium]|nr:helix-turn-helix transcriptional regulator [Candidatus Levybacteria bacterium]
MEKKRRGIPALPMEFIPPGIGRRAREGRLALGLSQELFGEKLGVTAARVSKAETGDTPYGAVGLIAVAQILGIPVEELCPPQPPISQVISEARIDLDLERDTVETAAGLAEGTVTLIENGYILDPDNLTRIGLSYALGVQVAEWTPQLYRNHVMRQKEKQNTS